MLQMLTGLIFWLCSVPWMLFSMLWRLTILACLLGGGYVVCDRLGYVEKVGGWWQQREVLTEQAKVHLARGLNIGTEEKGKIVPPTSVTGVFDEMMETAIKTSPGVTLVLGVGVPWFSFFRF